MKDILEEAEELLQLSPPMPWVAIGGWSIDRENYSKGEFWIAFGDQEEDLRDSSLMSKSDVDFLIRSRELLPQLIELLKQYRADLG